MPTPPTISSGRWRSCPAGEGPEELDLRLELADEMIRSGRFRGARPMAEQAAALARELGDACGLAKAAVALSSISVAGNKDQEIAALLEESLAALGSEDPGLRVLVHVGLAQEYFWEDVEGAGRENADEAVRIARELGDDAVLAPALAMWQFLDSGRPAPTAERLAQAEELIAVARRAGDRTSEIRGISFRHMVHLQAADSEAAARDFAEYKDLAERIAEPRHLWHVPLMRATRAIVRGRFAAARELAAEAARLGGLAEEPLAQQFHTLQLAMIHLLEGTPEEMLPSVRPMVERYPAIPAWEAGAGQLPRRCGPARGGAGRVRAARGDQLRELPARCQLDRRHVEDRGRRRR